MRGSVDNGEMTRPDVGIEFDNSNIKSKHWVSTDGTFNVESELAYKVCNHMTVAYKKKFNLLNPVAHVESAWGAAVALKDTGVKAGFLWNTNLDNWKLLNNFYTFHIHTKRGNNTVGAQIGYDTDSKKFTTHVGVELKQADHTGKVRRHESGLMRATQQWQLHQVAKATLNTSLNLADVPKGSVSSLPLNLTLEIKY